MTSKYKIHAIQNGEMLSSLDHILLNKAQALKLSPEEILPFGYSDAIEIRDGVRTSGVMSPVIIWLLLGPEGPILVDTGMPDCQEAQQVISAQGGEIKPCRQETDWRIENQLHRFGLVPNDIHTVILTHLHGDHYGNNERFAKASFYVHSEEIPWCLVAPAWAPFYRSGFRPHIINILDQVSLVENDLKLFEGIQLVHVGGHSPGLLSVLVDTKVGRVAIASDLIHSYRNLELNWPIGSYWSLSQVLDGMRKLREMADIVLPNHDYQLWEVHPQGVIG